jgi:hypothetical protein
MIADVGPGFEVLQIELPHRNDLVGQLDRAVFQHNDAKPVDLASIVRSFEKSETWTCGQWI